MAVVRDSGWDVADRGDATWGVLLDTHRGGLTDDSACGTVGVP